jgi:hypothetical protein
MVEQATARTNATAGAQLNNRFAESPKLEKAIRSNLEGLGYGG